VFKFRTISLHLALLGLALTLSGALVAQEDEAAAATEIVEAPGPADPIPLGAPPIEGLLFVGTSTNTNVPSDTLNDIFTVDPNTDSANAIVSSVQVWGATADPTNQRVLFTRASGLPPAIGQIGGGDELMEIPYAGGGPSVIGRITLAGEGLRVDGLALSGGVLYGFNAGNGADNGFYTIDMGTLEATLVAANPDSISGLDADPDTGIIYGVNDTSGQLVTIASDGTVSNVAAYPAGIGDIDGLAVGNGFAYLVTDESQPISVYDLNTGVYVSDLTSPFVQADTFSGAAYAVSGELPEAVLVPAVSFWGLAFLGLIVLGIAVVAIRR